MTLSKLEDITPMRVSGVENLVERAYNAGGRHLWVRETLVNALEAGATKIAFEIEEQAVRNKKIYRRIIADNGKGMNSTKLLEYFNTFGGGGKPIGGMHENFGIGSKTSLLPWNPHGVVVVSFTDGNAAMIWLRRNKSGEYGLRHFDGIDCDGNPTVLTAVKPFEDFDDYGCDWSDVKPEWIDKHGTVIVLLGESAESDTVSGDISRKEDSVDGITKYINTRMWQIPKGVSVHVRELTNSEKQNWPTEIAVETGERRRQLNRTIFGARKYLYEPGSWKHNNGKMKDSGTLVVLGGTKLHWAYWDGARPEHGACAQKDGYIAVLYKNELYNVKSHAATYKMFGIASQNVRSRVWIIAEPPLAGGEIGGVYPRADRNGLLMRGGRDAGQELPFSDWGQYFSENMPDPLRQALLAERSEDSGTLDDPNWREKLESLFGSRWRIRKYFLRPGHPSSRGHEAAARSHNGALKATSKSDSPKRKLAEPPDSPKSAVAGSGSLSGDKQKKSVRGGLPRYQWRAASEFDNPGFLASYHPNDPGDPNGMVFLNLEHPVVLDVVRHWQDQYPSHFAPVIQRIVEQVYGSNAVARIAHSQSLQVFFPAEKIENEFCSDVALTMSLLGLVPEEEQLATRVGGSCGKPQRRAA